MNTQINLSARDSYHSSFIYINHIPDTAQQLLPKKAAQITQLLGDQIYESYQDDVAVTNDQFRSEIRRWRAKWSAHEDLPLDLQGTLNSTNKDLYPGIFRVLNMYACMPVSTATAEPSLSTMRRVKTYLRNTMTTKRMSGLGLFKDFLRKLLGLLNIYREKEISRERVLDIFSRKKERKWALLFQN